MSIVEALEEIRRYCEVGDDNQCDVIVMSHNGLARMTVGAFLRTAYEARQQGLLIGADGHPAFRTYGDGATSAAPPIGVALETREHESAAWLQTMGKASVLTKTS